MSGAGGRGSRHAQAGEGHKGPLRAVGKHWEVLSCTVSPSDFHWFAPRPEVLSTCVPARSPGPRSSLLLSAAFQERKRKSDSGKW